MKVIIFFLLFPMALAAQPASMSDEFLPLWKRACAYTLEAADAMPDSLYDFRPRLESMSFGSQLIHIAENLYFLNSKFILETDFPTHRYTQRPADSLSKAEIRAVLVDAFAYVEESLSTLSDSEWQALANGFWAPEPTTKRVIFLLMRDHMTHHRGNLVIYLREQGIKPPQYRGW